METENLTFLSQKFFFFFFSFLNNKKMFWFDPNYSKSVLG
jgi:hypothetical protein